MDHTECSSAVSPTFISYNKVDNIFHLHLFFLDEYKLDAKTMWSKARLLCIFSLVLYCFDSGSDIFVSVSLFLNCHTRYAAAVISLVFLPGIVCGAFEYFRLEEREWKHVFYFSVLYPIFFLPLCLWKLLKAVVESEGTSNSSSTEEDEAKRY